MASYRGTPKSLKEAIQNGHDEMNMEAHVRDYLAQKFSAAMMRAKGQELENLKSLWEKITQVPVAKPEFSKAA